MPMYACRAATPYTTPSFHQSDGLNVAHSFHDAALYACDKPDS
ncbi:hypothetical protein [Bifidobacterium apri]|nr:hypothetical protein [Bifidobacterium apri]